MLAHRNNGPCLLRSLRCRFYHGHVTSVADQYSGQIAPLIVYKPGILDEEGMPTVRSTVSAPKNQA